MAAYTVRVSVRANVARWIVVALFTLNRSTSPAVTAIESALAVFLVAAEILITKMYPPTTGG